MSHTRVFRDRNTRRPVWSEANRGLLRARRTPACVVALDLPDASGARRAPRVTPRNAADPGSGVQPLRGKDLNFPQKPSRLIPGTSCELAHPRNVLRKSNRRIIAGPFTMPGERYKDKIKAWWFDSSYSLDTFEPVTSTWLR